MQSSILLALAIAVAVTAIPSHEAYEVVPETLEYVENSASDYAKAKKSVQSLMQTGKTNKECRDLATSSKKAIEDDVKADQKILDALPTGGQCVNKGQSLVTSSNNSLKKANDDEKDAKNKLEKAKAANVDFGSIPYNQLVPGQCGTFFNNQGYKSAQATLVKAQAKHDKANGAAVTAQKAFDDAKAAAADEKAACLCSTKKAHDKAWGQIKTTKHKAALDWKTAHNVKCVLDGTPVSKCKVPAEPKVKVPKLNAEAANAKCGNGKMGTTTTLYSKCTKLNGEKVEYLDRQNVMCGKDQALTSFTLTKGACSGKNMQYTFTCGSLKLGAVTNSSTPCTSLKGKTLEFLDRQKPKCASGEVMTGFTLKACQGSNMGYQVSCAKPFYKQNLGKATVVEGKCKALEGKDDQYLDRLKPKCPTGSAITGFRLTQGGPGCGKGGFKFRYAVSCVEP